MVIIRDDYTAALAGIHAHGRELLERYRDLVEQAVVSKPTEVLLTQVVDKRRAMLERIEAMERARGDLPKAGNEERALILAITDWVQSRVQSESSLIMRLIQADEQWQNEVIDAAELDWSEDEQDVLSQLIIHSERFVDELRFLQAYVN